MTTTTDPTPTTNPPIDSIDGPASAGEPAVRGEQTPLPPTQEDCLTPAGPIPWGQWEPVAWPDNAGTTEWGFVTCSPIQTPTTTPTTATVSAAPDTAPMLPATGLGTLEGVAIAATAVLAGTCLRRLART